MQRVTMRELLEAGVHFGHQTRYWCPHMAPYLFGARKNIHIINLEKTLPLYEKALDFVTQVVSRREKILFVGTKHAAQDAIVANATRCGMPYISKRWLGGLLTNFKTVKRSIKRLKELEEMEAEGKLEHMSKKEVLSHQRHLRKLQMNLSGIKDMDRLPDVLFVVDVGYENIAVKEAMNLNIPIIGIVDSNNTPIGVDYVIPGNDDSIRSIELYTKHIADVIEENQGVNVLPDNVAGDNDEYVEVNEKGMPIEDSTVSVAKTSEKDEPESVSDDVSAGPSANQTPELPENNLGKYLAEDVIVILSKDATYRAGSLRASYWQRICEFEQKSLQELEENIRQHPSSLPEKGKPKPLSYWLTFFKKEKLLELKSAK